MGSTLGGGANRFSLALLRKMNTKYSKSDSFYFRNIQKKADSNLIDNNFCHEFYLNNRDYLVYGILIACLLQNNNINIISYILTHPYFYAHINP